MTDLPHIGEIFALITALFWATAVILFKKSGETVHPIALNLFKSVFGGLLILPTIWIVEGTGVPSFPRGDALLLVISGALGIGIADTLFFMSLNRLGAALSSIVDCLYSPMVIAAAMIWLGERLSVLQIVGVVLIISAVWEATHTKHESRAARVSVWWGIFWGASAMAIMAIGIVMMKPLLNSYSLLWVMEMRLVGGIAILLVILAFTRERRAVLSSLLVKKGWGYMLSGSFVGSYVALITWIAGIKYTQASQASALNQTSNIFVFVLAGVLLKEKLTVRRIVGIGLAVVGVYLVTFG